MGALSNYSEEKYVEHFLRNNPVASPEKVYFAAFESDPGEDGLGTETAYTGYARQESQWTALDANGQTKNVNTIAFPANGNASAPVAITHGAVFDALEGGNLILKGPLKTTKNIQVGDVLAFSENALTLTLD